MTPWEERDEQLKQLFREEILRAKSRKDACDYPRGSFAESCQRFEIMGMQRLLAFIDPECVIDG